VSGAIRDGPKEPPRDKPAEGRDDAEERWDIAMGQKRWFAEYVRVLCEYDNVGGMQVADSVRRHSSNEIRREAIGPGTSYVFCRELSLRNTAYLYYYYG
jgi:hypothetical protein